MSTSVTIDIPEQVVINLSANSHAAQTQYLEFSTADTNVTFTGTGENVPMTTPDGDTSYPMSTRRSGGVLTLTFSSSGNANPKVSTPVQHGSGTYVFYTCTSEDDKDDDNNDTYAFIQWDTAAK